MSAPISLLGIGTPVRIKDIRSGQDEKYTAWVTSFDEGTGRHFVTKLNNNGSNRAGPALEVIPRALRFDDGSPVQDGEDYVIEAITGATADMTKAMTDAALTIQKFSTALDEIKADAKARDVRIHNSLSAVVETICGLLADPRSSDMLREAMRLGVPVTGKEAPKTEKVEVEAPAPRRQKQPQPQPV